MRTVLTAALALVVLAAPAFAATSLDAPTLEVAQAKPTTGGAADDDEEDPAPGAKTPEAKPEVKPGETPLAAAAAPVPAAPSNPDEQKLVSGAPLYNPNVAVHIVEQKKFSDAKKFEAILFPAIIQTNGKFTQHYGTGLGLMWHLHENFGFQISGYYNWSNTEAAFNDELVEKVRASAQAATSLLNTWGALAGVEVTPLYGKFAFYEDTLIHFSLVLNGGAGLGGTRHQLKPENTAGPATFGETGMRFLGELGGGLRVQIGKRFALRLELRDIIYTARVDQVNGCSRDDLKALDNAYRAASGMDLDSKIRSVGVSGGCNVENNFVGSYTYTDANGQTQERKRADDIPQANNLVNPPGMQPSSDVLNNLGLYLGASFIF